MERGGTAAPSGSGTQRSGLKTRQQQHAAARASGRQGTVAGQQSGGRATTTAGGGSSPLATGSVLPVEPWTDPPLPPPLPQVVTEAVQTTEESPQQPQPQPLFEDDTTFAIDLGTALNGKTVGWMRPKQVAAGDPPLCIVADEKSGTLDTECPAYTALPWLSSAMASVLVFGKRPWECIWPKSAEGVPQLSPTGRYEVKLCWGGAWKKVVVDDRMPHDSAGTVLLLQSTSKNELWPSIISKAALKLAANRHPALRLELFWVHALTGMVPQQEQSLPWSTLSRLVSSGSYCLAVPRSLPSQQQQQQQQQLQLDRVSTVISAKEDNGSRLISLSNGKAEAAMAEKEFWETYSLDVYIDQLKSTQSIEQEAPKATPFTVVFPNREVPSKLVVCGFLTPTSSQMVRFMSRQGVTHDVGGTWTLEPFEWDSPFSSNKVSLTFKGGSIAACQIAVPPGRAAFTVKTDCLLMSRVTFWSDSEFEVEETSKVLQDKLGITTTVLEGAFKTQDPNTWVVWFRHVVTVKAGLRMVARLNVSDEATRQYAKLHLVNNDTLAEFGSFFSATDPVDLVPNIFGYTLYADVKCPAKISSGTYQLQILSSSPEIAIEQDVPKHIHDHEEPSITPDNTHVLLRQVLKPAATTVSSIHVSVAPLTTRHLLPHVKVQLLDNNEVVVERSGTSCAIIPVAKLIKPPKEDERSHKYILQVTVTEGTEFTTLPLALDAPVSRAVSARRPAAKTAKAKQAAVATVAAAATALLQPTAHTSEQPTTRGTAVVAAADGQPIQYAWKLRIYSGMPTEVRKDTEKEEKHAAIRAKWDDGSVQNRSQKAQAARGRWLDQAQAASSGVKPLEMRRTNGTDQVVASKESLDSLVVALTEEAAAKDKLLAALLSTKDRDKEKCTKSRDEFDAEIRKRQAALTAWYTAQNEPRVSFNKERQEAAAIVAMQAEQQRQLELQAQQQQAQLQAQAQAAEAAAAQQSGANQQPAQSLSVPEERGRRRRQPRKV